MGVFEDDLRFFATAHGITGTEHLSFKLLGRDVVHTVEHDPFKEGAQPPSACTSPHGFCSHDMESFACKGQGNTFHDEQPLILLDYGIPRIPQNPHQSNFVQFLKNGSYGKAANMLGDQAKTDRVFLGKIVFQHSGRVFREYSRRTSGLRQRWV
ncbi:hypothetical protein FDZ71_06715 [bacterium]|nr:MAG: hypothetical protein FDZ71_06715 [bacterium]